MTNVEVLVQRLDEQFELEQLLKDAQMKTACAVGRLISDGLEMQDQVKPPRARLIKDGSVQLTLTVAGPNYRYTPRYAD